MNAAIRIANVSHRYGATVALDEVSVELPTGRLVGFIGPDGVGKSTLLGLLTGSKELQSGEIGVFGGDMGKSAHRRRVSHRIAYMPQGLGRNLYAELSVRENLEFFGSLFGHDTGQRDARIDRLLAATGLAPFPDRPAGKLSGGMKQKLGLCGALIHDPDLLVLDEPTTGVDPLSRRQFWDLLASLRAQRPQMSVVVSTSHMDEAAAFDWLVAMDRGRVLHSGTPANIIQATGADTLEAAYRALRPGAGDPADVVLPKRMEDCRDPIIVAKGLTRRFGDFTAVDDVSFEIERGEIFGFLGSNGCGKSTTMKMLTGLLPASAGEATLLGRPINASDVEARRHIGYMSQAFSLYGELTLRQNLDLHARLYELPVDQRLARIAEMVGRFGLGEYLGVRADALPLGVRQRLSLAVSVLHQPSVLILDEPTSGVDPDARGEFWKLIIELSRRENVTIFLSTHFMAEAEWCDRISLMHEGRVLACDTPARLKAAAGVRSLEDAFIAKLSPDEPELPSEPAGLGAWHGSEPRQSLFSLRRMAAYARRETLEVRRDPVRLSFAVLGSAILMVIFCFGISLDVEDLDFAILDYSQSPESRAYIAAFEGSRYFEPPKPVRSVGEGRQRLIDGEVSLIVEIPSDFGRRVRREAEAEVLAIVDGAMPFKGETVEGYVTGIHAAFLAEQAKLTGQRTRETARIETRFRYNQSFESIAAMAPAMPAILLILLPAILTAVSVARERELGSITNFYVTPTTRLEFMLGKQAPYTAVAFANFLLLTAMTDWLFGVPLKGAFLPLLAGAVFYVWATTAFGLVISTVTSSQVAAVFATALSSIIPTIQFSGLLQPVSTLEGGARLIGEFWPASYFLHLNVGAFTKGLGWEGLAPDILALAMFGPAFTLIAVLALRAQER